MSAITEVVRVDGMLWRWRDGQWRACCMLVIDGLDTRATNAHTATKPADRTSAGDPSAHASDADGSQPN